MLIENKDERNGVEFIRYFYRHDIVASHTVRCLCEVGDWTLYGMYVVLSDGAPSARNHVWIEDCKVFPNPFVLRQ